MRKVGLQIRGFRYIDSKGGNGKKNAIGRGKLPILNIGAFWAAKRRMRSREHSERDMAAAEGRKWAERRATEGVSPHRKGAGNPSEGRRRPTWRDAAMRGDPAGGMETQPEGTAASSEGDAAVWQAS